MNSNYDEILRDIQHDNKSGAWVVARKAVDCLEALMMQKSDANVKELISEVERVAGEILKAQTGMAQLINLFNTIFFTIENETSNDTLALSRKISGEAKRFDEFSRNAVSKVAELGADLIAQDTIVLMHSNSSTIFEIIKKAHADGKSFQVIQSESRPVCEGRTSATELSKLGIPTIYLFDAAIGRGMERADIVLLGTDSLSQNLLVNKIGTKAICLLAKEAVVPCYAACESSKFIPQQLKPKKEQHRDPNEVWKNPPAETTVENYYFDSVPLDLFTGIITEEGILTPAEAGGKIRAQEVSMKLRDLLK